MDGRKIAIAAAAAVLNMPLSDSSSSESDDEYDDVIMRRIILMDQENNERVKITDYWENVIPRYNSEDFRSHFRLTREAVEKLIAAIQKVTPWNNGVTRPKVCFEKAVLLFLWVIGNQESFRGVSDRFGVGKGHAHRIFISMCENVTAITKDIIRWPTGNELNRTLQEFEELRPPPGFPGVVGCVDGTHIEVPGPKGDNSFYNRNKYHSVILQGICDASGAFIDVYFGWPGSVHDARVWKHSPIYLKLETEPNFLPENVHILGDSAYPLAKYMMTVYRDNGFLTPKQRQFNRLLSSKRVVIENAFGRLKQLFRRLKYLNMLRFDKLKYVVLAACVCHNIATWQNAVDDDIEHDEGLRVPQIGNDDDAAIDDNAGKNKRNAIADMLFDH